MALTDNPIVKALMAQQNAKPPVSTTPANKAPQVSATPTTAAPQGQASAAQGQSPVPSGMSKLAQPSVPQAPTAEQLQRFPRPVKVGAPNRDMNPLAPTEDNNEYNPMGYSPIPLYDNGGDVNTKQNTAPTHMKSIVPVYDNGGDVATDAGRKAQSEADARLQSLVNAPSEHAAQPAPVQDTTGNQGAFGIAGFKQIGKDKEAAKEARLTTPSNGNVMQPSYMPGGTGAAPAPDMPLVPVGKPPVYDDGGDVDVNDGKHQVAILQDGEKVLTPEKAEQYRAEHPEEKPEGPTTVATNTGEQNLRPYSQVMEEKAKAKAAEQVRNPGVQTTTSDVSNNEKIQEQPVEEEKPKKTLGSLLALDWAKKVMPGLTKPAALGGQPDSGAPQGPQPTQGPQAPASPQGTPAPTSGMKPIVPNHEARVAKYDADIQAALDQGTAEGHEKALLLQEAKQNYLKGTPWGSKENHPGVLGKLGRAASIAGQLGLAATAPGLNKIIPGTVANRNVEAAKTEKEIPEAIKATAEEDKANKENAIPGFKQVTGGAIQPGKEDQGPQVAFYNEKDPTHIIYAGPVTPKAGATQDKKAFEATLAKVGTPDVADPSQQKSALETAHKNKVIDDQEYSNALAYLGANNAPATQATAAEEKRTAGKVMYFDTPTGRKALTSEEAKNQGLDPANGISNIPATQVEKDREKNKTYNVVQKSLEQYQKHIEEGKLKPTDIPVLTSITEESEKPDYISKMVAGAFDALLGHPVTGYSEQLMKGTLNKNQYQDLSPAARQVLADYYTTMMAHFANLKASQGQIPRSPAIIKNEMHTIPQPYLSGEESKASFQNYLDQVAMRNSDNVDFGGATGGAAKTTARPEGVPDTATHVYRDKQNKVVGYALDGQYHSLTQ